jgi:hypothetical protein
MHGNKARVYYRSKDDRLLTLARVEVKQLSTGSPFLDAKGARINVTEYHVIPAENA